jgi:hypothetical protein
MATEKEQIDSKEKPPATGFGQAAREITKFLQASI